MACTDQVSVQVHPIVDSVSSELGSLAGGHVLHIRGRGFGNMVHAVHVDIAGVPCKVLTTSDSDITCHTTPWQSSVNNYTLFQGGSGVNLTQYTGVP